MPLLDVVEVATLQLSQLTLTSTDTARNLGCFFDRHMQLDRLVSSYCSSAYYHLRTINNIRHLLTLDACHAAVRSLVLIRLDLIVAWHRLNADLLKCYAIKTKFDSYSSFRVLADAHLEKLLEPSIWPAGVLIRDFV